MRKKMNTKILQIYFSLMHNRKELHCTQLCFSFSEVIHCRWLEQENKPSYILCVSAQVKNLMLETMCTSEPSLELVLWHCWHNSKAVTQALVVHHLWEMETSVRFSQLLNSMVLVHNHLCVCVTIGLGITLRILINHRKLFLKISKKIKVVMRIFVYR